MLEVQYDGTPTDVEFGVGGQINYGARFNGSSSKITLPTGSPFDNSNTIKCISAWIKPSTTTSNVYIYSVSSTTDTKDYFTFDWVQSSWTGAPDLRVRVQNGDSGQRLDALVDVTATDDWVHVVAQLGTEVELYINSVKQTVTFDKSGSATNSWWINDISYSTSAQALIGQYRAVTALNADGDIDQLRFFNRSLSQGEIDTLYAETACVYTCTTDTVDYPTTNLAYYKLDNSATDETGSYDGTETDISYTFGRFGQAASFNGSSSYIDTSVSVLPADNYTVSMWVLHNSLKNSCALYTQYRGSVAGRHIVNSNANGTIQINTSSTNSLASITATPFTTGIWQHLVVTKSSSTGYTVYIDGSSIGTWSNTDNIITDESTQFGGDTDWAGDHWLDGKIDQVRIFSSALDSTQVTQLYEEKPCADTSTFKTVLYEGNGSTQYISNVGFQPDLVWVKSRDSSGYYHNLFDSLRGATYRLVSNLTNAQDANGRLSSFDTNGFSLISGGDANTSGQSMVAWCWKAGGDAVSNTDGTITSQVSANTAAGFSIVKYTGTGAAGMTFGHGLDTPPELVFIKNLDNSTNWQVFGGSLFTRMQLDQTGGDDGNLGITITSTTIQTTQVSGQEGNSAWNATDDYIAYIWHSVSGVSKVGSYSGLGTSAVTVTTDFEPKFLLIKRYDSTGGNWYMYDQLRDGTNDRQLYANTSGQESTTADVITYNSDGFTIASSGSGVNASGGTYIYLAFA